jgi:hypothetical protein
MGRTLPTIVQTLQAEEEAWKLFRRALRKEDQEAFDALWRFARYHAAPASMASRPMPFEAAIMAMMVAVERQIIEMEKLEKKRREDGGAQNGRVDL